MNEVERNAKKVLYCNLIRAGMTLTSACREAGIAIQTFYNWRESDMDFSRQFDLALEYSCDLVEIALRERAKTGDVRACEVFLRARRPAYYAQKHVQEITVNSGAREIEALKTAAAQIDHPAEIEMDLGEDLGEDLDDE